MNGDHHGREAERATLLVRVMDEILGTHNTGSAIRLPKAVPLVSLTQFAVVCSDAHIAAVRRV
jgi:hypothetical protein